MPLHQDVASEDYYALSLTALLALPLQRGSYCHSDLGSSGSSTCCSSGSKTPTLDCHDESLGKTFHGTSLSQSILPISKNGSHLEPRDQGLLSGIPDPFISPVRSPVTFAQNPPVTAFDSTVTSQNTSQESSTFRPPTLLNHPEYPGKMAQAHRPFFGPQNAAIQHASTIRAPEIPIPFGQVASTMQFAMPVPMRGSMQQLHTAPVLYQPPHVPSPQIPMTMAMQPQPPALSAAFQAPMTVDRVARPDTLPFAHIVKNRVSPQWGVMKIENLPYSITKQEIVQFLGRHARILTPDLGCPIHIVMERSTAKTMDCYVEFVTPADAEATVRRLNSIVESGRPPRLGHRHVDLTISSQDELLKDLFPRAKCVRWRNGVPHLVPNTDLYSSGFQGILTSEEVLGVIRHAEQPHRSPFSQKCPQRTYESIISTIWKYPWFATTMYTVADRDGLFNATNRQLLALTARISKEKVIGLDRKLVSDLLRAGLACPAFNERQKYTLVCHSEELSPKLVLFPNLHQYWPFDTLVKRPNASEQEMSFYVGLMQKGLPIYDVESKEVVNSWRNIPTIALSPWGKIWIEWNFHNNALKFEDAAQLELQVAKTIAVDGLNEIKSYMREVTMGNFNMMAVNYAASRAIKQPPNVNHSREAEIPYGKEAARRAVINYTTPCRQSRVGDQFSHISDPTSRLSVPTFCPSEVSSYTSEISDHSVRTRLSLPPSPPLNGIGVQFPTVPIPSPTRIPPVFGAHSKRMLDTPQRIGSGKHIPNSF